MCSTILCFLFFQPSTVIGQTDSSADSLKSVLEKENNDSLKIIHKIKYSRELHRLGNNNSSSYDYAQEAIEQALAQQDTILYARALDNLGLFYRFDKFYKEALENHRKAYDLVKDKSVDPKLKMRFANNAGVAARYFKKYDTSLSFYMEALKIAEKEENYKDIAIASNGIGNVLGHMPNRDEEAFSYFMEALDAEKKQNNSLGLAMNYLSISDYYIEKEDFPTARRCLDTLLRLNQKRDDKFGLALTYEFIGRSYLKEGKNLHTAKAYFQNALQRFKNINNPYKQVELLSNIGDIYYHQNHLVKAEKQYRESLQLAEELKENDLIQKSSSKLSRALEEKDEYQDALFYYKQAQAYGDSIKINEQNVKIEALTRKYNLEKKKGQIELLEKDKALQQTVLDNQDGQLKRRRVIMVLMGIAILFLVIIFILQYRNYLIRKESNARLIKEEKEKTAAIYERNLARAENLVTRLRINPHFLFNSLNAITYLIQSDQKMKAIKYLKIFSRYTRMVLETSKQQVIPLEEELKLSEYYLLLEGNRFEKDFQYIFVGRDNSEIDDLDTPPLILQPFLENAIWHGLLPSELDKKILKIKIEHNPNSTQIIVDDNGIGREKSVDLKKHRRKPHKSMGIQIIKERIDLYNKSQSGKIEYDIIDKKDDNGNPKGTQVILTLYQDQKGEPQQSKHELALN